MSIGRILRDYRDAGEMLVDDSASTTVHQLGDALTELEVHGHFFGRCSLELVLHTGGTEPRVLQHLPSGLDFDR